MRITHISIENFRNFARGDFSFSERTAITGANGTGKTSIVEAVNYLSSFKSFRSASDAKVLKIGKKAFVINADGEREGEKFNIGLQYANSKKTLSFNKERIDKLTDGFGVFISVTLSIYDKLLSHQYSIYRRKFVDKLISTIDSDYFESLIVYHSVLKQKNNALKTTPERNLIGAYNRQLSEKSEYIYEKRIEFAQYFEEVLNAFYAKIFNKKDLIRVRYFSSKDSGDYKNSALMSAAERIYEKEILRKRSLCGVHLDDYIITVDNHPISEFGSEGEKILLGITLKLSEIQLIYENKGEHPVIIIDDAFSELDGAKRTSMLEIFEEFPQLIITYPKKHDNHPSFSLIDLDARADESD